MSISGAGAAWKRLLREDQWRLWTLLIWLGITIYMIVKFWGRIHWFALGDTDDNLRMMEVRAWLDGQGWYDLRQYRLNPPEGFNIHWSRLVDIPIAGIILAVKPLFGTAVAERAAIALAPLLPLGVVLLGLGAAVRRLVAPWSFPLVAMLLVLGAGSAAGMFTPARIDHHNWQLAMLAVIVAGLADSDRRHGGLTIGIGSALSLVIGLEMMPYLGLAGAAVVLRWIWDKAEAARLQTYAIALAGGSALGYLVFASYDNRMPRCDVLSPVWMSTMVLAGALLFVLARMRLESRGARLGASVVAAGILGAFFIGVWPHCLGRPEGVSDELQKSWLDNIREVRPVYRQEWRVMAQMLALPVIGMIGTLVAFWFNRRDRDRLMAWASVALLSSCGFAMMFFQSRAAPAAQLLAIPGGVALIWLVLPIVRGSRSFLIRVVGTVALVLIGSGNIVSGAIALMPKKAETAARVKVRKAGAACGTIPAMEPLDKFPRTVVMTMNDLGPRLITLTHHDAISGPYHRNGESILDLHHAFDGTPETARAVARKHGATLLLICPGFAEGTVYRARAPKGFYAGLEAGKVPDWLEPLPLPEHSPFKLWRIKD
ncbi:AcrB/AcrD/AcrF family protein [Sphingomonas sp. C3-2]|uniref:AcrB/AcrD/AcrF family protein n=1 Tax=Sphingomonas sp. C3-2 TaxID=3062169 RepID=UPI00294B4A40|nr:AcrB/AcrD/AcrF family protein [Sphingomonas sp. C3-2]WOK35138.1 AcrB/AcrD/AcrF family protein [Sphingomonas sp. C3-2]